MTSRLAMHPKLYHVVRSFAKQLPDKLDSMAAALQRQQADGGLHDAGPGGGANEHAHTPVAPPGAISSSRVGLSFSPP